MSQAIPRDVYPFGRTQKFLYDIGGTHPIEVDLNENNFYIDGGEKGTIKLIGYSRFEAESEEPQHEKTAMKRHITRGTIGKASQEFRWKLTNLTKAQFKLLKGIALRSGREYDSVTVGSYTRQITRPVILRDQLFVMEEDLPRTRPKIGTYTDSFAAPGIAYYWGIFAIHLKIDKGDWERWGCGGDSFTLNMSAIEHDPLPLTNDI